MRSSVHPCRLFMDSRGRPWTCDGCSDTHPKPIRYALMLGKPGARKTQLTLPDPYPIAGYVSLLVLGISCCRRSRVRSAGHPGRGLATGDSHTAPTPAITEPQHATAPIPAPAAVTFSIRSRDTPRRSASERIASRFRIGCETMAASSLTRPPHASSMNTIAGKSPSSAMMNAHSSPECPPAVYGTTWIGAVTSPPGGRTGCASPLRRCTTAPVPVKESKRLALAVWQGGVHGSTTLSGPKCAKIRSHYPASGCPTGVRGISNLGHRKQER